MLSMISNKQILFVINILNAVILFILLYLRFIFISEMFSLKYDVTDILICLLVSMK
jgi:hypothetical protein